jgi:hypothetical protein
MALVQSHLNGTFGSVLPSVLRQSRMHSPSVVGRRGVVEGRSSGVYRSSTFGGQVIGAITVERLLDHRRTSTMRPNSALVSDACAAALLRRAYYSAAQRGR